MKRKDFFEIWSIYISIFMLALVISYFLLIPVLFNQLTFEVFIGYYVFGNFLFFVIIFSLEISSFFKKYEIKIIIKKRLIKKDDM